MYTSMLSAVSGMRAAQLKMDAIGNNVANVNTYGFKSQDITFGSILADQMQVQPSTTNEQGRLTPPQLRVGYGAMAQLHRLHIAPGTPLETKVDTDFYIQGDAFFAVEGENGEAQLTRMGAFQVINHGDGRMVLGTSDGRRVLDSQQEMIEVPDGYKIQVRENGQVLFVNQFNANDVLDNGISLALYDVANRQRLIPVGENRYDLPEGTQPQPANGSLVKQGFLESSNVDMQKEMASLIEMQRTFQFNSRALSYIDQMSETINNIYGR